MINVVFYAFAKKVNSTVQPVGAGTTLSCELIENTDIISPKLRIHDSSTILIKEKNYCYIADFGRYYFVQDWEWQLGTWIVQLRVDPLATARTLIGASTQYVLRCASEFDGAIEDTMYPVKNDFHTATYYTTDSGHQGVEAPVYCDIDDIGQWYVVGIIGCQNGVMNNNGSVTYYVLSETQYNGFVHDILSSTSIYGISPSEISDALQRQLINPIQYIASVMLLPFKPQCVYNAEAQDDKLYFTVQFGMVELNVTNAPFLLGGVRMLQRASSASALYAQNLSGWISHHSVQTAVYLHPQYSRGKWVLGKPYSKYVIMVEPWGEIEIPGEVVLEAYKQLDANQDPYFVVYFHSYLDASTGACRLEISTSNEDGNNVPFYVETVNLGIDVPCHQAIQDVMTYNKGLYELMYSKKSAQIDTGFGIASATTFGLLGAATNQAGQSAGMLGGLKNAYMAPLEYSYKTEPLAIQNLQAANYPTISGSGSSKDSFMMQARDLCSPRIFAYWAILCDDNNRDHGRPLCQEKQINTLSGFIQCDNTHFHSYLTDAENSAINEAMQGGFYYE